MIFATVGTQLPFDRLMTALDDWAASNPDITVTAQTGRSTNHFRHMTCTPSMTQPQFGQAFNAARVIVAHAGMGSILSACRLGKPILLMPRRAALAEHRNDHQLDTADEMACLPNVLVVHTGLTLSAALTEALSQPAEVAGRSACASPQLIANLQRFIFANRQTGVAK